MRFWTHLRAKHLLERQLNWDASSTTECIQTIDTLRRFILTHSQDFPVRSDDFPDRQSVDRARQAGDAIISSLNYDPDTRVVVRLTIQAIYAFGMQYHLTKISNSAIQVLSGLCAFDDGFPNLCIPSQHEDPLRYKANLSAFYAAERPVMRRRATELF